MRRSEVGLWRETSTCWSRLTTASYRKQLRRTDRTGFNGMKMLLVSVILLHAWPKVLAAVLVVLVVLNVLAAAVIGVLMYKMYKGMKERKASYFYSLMRDMMTTVSQFFSNVTGHGVSSQQEPYLVRQKVHAGVLVPLVPVVLLFPLPVVTAVIMYKRMKNREGLCL
ncbi:uncharacterized protein AKAME5_002389500 [Lates japonicus]|uniref:Uncharacterized protein n=1 Tax=Lates japonicus TaxID=270547 RepID=A0AAD3RLN8_LATJO|nr:uncharacterized protein AKAME5_002389500 [Lates japonicus]